MVVVLAVGALECRRRNLAPWLDRCRPGQDGRMPTQSAASALRSGASSAGSGPRRCHKGGSAGRIRADERRIVVASASDGFRRDR